MSEIGRFNYSEKKKNSWHGEKTWEMTSCSANWTTPANVSYQSGDFGSTQASAQICMCSSCVTQSKGAIVPQPSICKLYPLPINYVFVSEDNDPFVDVRSKRKFLLYVFPVSYSRVQSPDFLPLSRSWCLNSCMGIQCIMRRFTAQLIGDFATVRFP